MKRSGFFKVKLSGKGKFKRLLGDHFKEKGLRAGLVRISPGQEIGEHTTGKKEEALIILEGSALIHYGKAKKSKAAKGTFVFIPPGTTHNVLNTDKKVLQYVYVTAYVA
jgi:mannose-6-phosphate isomerase-like protein (cupin superfamily)